MLFRSDAFDDLYVYASETKTWTCLYKGEAINKLSLEGRQVCFCGKLLVAVAVGSPGQIDLVSTLDIEELEKDGDNFLPVTIENMKARAVGVEEAVRFIADGLENTPEEGDFSALKHAMDCIYQAKNRADELEFELDSLQEVASYLGELGEGGAVSMAAGKVQQLQEAWSSSKKKLPILRKAIKPQIEAEGSRISEEIKEFEEEVEQYREKFLQEPIFEYETGVEASYEGIDTVHVDLKEVEAAAANMLELATIFEFPELTDKLRSVVGTCRKDLALVKKLWDLINVVTTSIDEWNLTLWNDINTGSMEEEAKGLAKSVKSLDKRLRDFNAYAGVDSLLKNFMVALPCISDLRSPSMRDRHWQQLMEITGVQFVIDEKFSLQDLMKLELHKFVDDVGEVVDRAQKEDKMEQSLGKLKVTWASIEFQFDQHRDTPVYLFRMAEEDFETLEDNQLVVQGMMASKYLATFEEEVTGWQKSLANVSDVLAQMTEVQRKWANLETLFIGSEEVKKELPESTERFVGIDKSFRKALEEMRGVKNCVKACNGSDQGAGLLKLLEEMASGLELCEKDLADFLESKRRIFPRFYFTPQTLLLDVLSNGNRPWVVAQHINNMFQGIKKLELSGEPAITINKYISNEGEALETKTAGPLKLTGKVEKYLGEVIDHVRSEMMGQMGKSVSDYDTRPRKDWLFDHLAQIVIVTTQIKWTATTEAAFDGMQAGDKNALKADWDKLVEMLSDLIKLVQGDLDPLQRRKIMNMITMETHSRDINKGMIEDGFDDKSCFKWVGQLKTRWEKKDSNNHAAVLAGPQDKPDCWIFICDANFQYSFEYLGNAARLVITPLTDRKSVV